MKDIKDVAVVVQARLNSQRLPNKMLNPFCGTSLFEVALKKLQLSKIIPASNVYLSINEDELCDIAKKYDFNVFQRSLESSSEDNDIRLIYEWWDQIPFKYVVLVSACNPLLKVETIDRFVEDFLVCNKEGSFAVFEKKTYYWSLDGTSLTDWKNQKIMNTKEVDAIYEAGHCLYASRLNFLKDGNWMDNKVPPSPNMFVIEELESFDIDFQWQFDVAEILYKKYSNTLV